MKIVYFSNLKYPPNAFFNSFKRQTAGRRLGDRAFGFFSVTIFKEERRLQGKMEFR